MGHTTSKITITLISLLLVCELYERLMFWDSKPFNGMGLRNLQDNDNLPRPGSQLGSRSDRR